MTIHIAAGLVLQVTKRAVFGCFWLYSAWQALVLQWPWGSVKWQKVFLTTKTNVPRWVVAMVGLDLVPVQLPCNVGTSSCHNLLKTAQNVSFSVF